MTADPEAVAAAPHAALVTSDGTVPTSSPYVVWTPAGGPNGTIVVSAGCCSDLYINKKLGAADAWERVPTDVGASYTRSLLVLSQDPSTVLIAGAGKLPPSTTNQVQVSTFKVQ